MWEHFFIYIMVNLATILKLMMKPRVTLAIVDCRPKHSLGYFHFFASHTHYYIKHVIKFSLIPWIYDTCVLYRNFFPSLSAHMLPLTSCMIALPSFWHHYCCWILIPCIHLYIIPTLVQLYQATSYLCVISHQKVTLTWGWRSSSFMFV